MIEITNNRILVIDDEEAVRDSFRLILATRPAVNQELDQLAAVLFDDHPQVDDHPHAPRPPSQLVEFTVDEASSGEAGVEMARSAILDGRPYAAVFVDMRMPGWDGVETVQHLRKIDRLAEVIFVTAYSDTSIEDIVERAGPNVGYHLKPFAPEEIKQIATKAVYDWNKLRRLEQLIDLIGTLKTNATELDALLDHIFSQVVGWIGAESALLAKRLSDGHFEPVLATGTLRQEAAVAVCLNRLGDQPDSALDPSFVCFRLERYDLVALLERSARLNSEKLYLLELFTRHAGQAIENLRLHETVMRGEKLAAVGLAIGKVAHDIRSPVAAIQGAINLLRQHPANPALIDRLLDAMYNSSEEALALAGDLLAFTRNAVAHPERIRTADLFQAITERTAGDLARLGISLRLESENAETFIADRGKLVRALLNLVQNASEALQSSSTLLPSIQLRITREDDTMRLEVADNGPGIPASLQSTLFEPFTTYGKSGGTGLGLAIVRQAAEAHGGSVDLTSSQAGARFAILLPQQEQMPDFREA